MVGNEIFIGCDYFSFVQDTEKIFFSLIQTTYVYRLVQVIGEGFHKIEDDPEHNKNRKTRNKLTADARGKITSVEQKREISLVSFKTDQEIRQQQIAECNQQYRKQTPGRKQGFLCNIFG